LTFYRVQEAAAQDDEWPTTIIITHR
jgi:hypothetical protein